MSTRPCDLPNRRWRRSAGQRGTSSTTRPSNHTAAAANNRQPAMPQSIASLSLDLDNKWSYLKTHGDRGWESYPSYLDTVVPRFVDLLSDVGLRITVFVAAQDAPIRSNHDALARLTAAGHGVGNHSFHHEPWLHL